MIACHLGPVMHDLEKINKWHDAGVKDDADHISPLHPDEVSSQSVLSAHCDRSDIHPRGKSLFLIEDARFPRGKSSIDQGAATNLLTPIRATCPATMP